MDHLQLNRPRISVERRQRRRKVGARAPTVKSYHPAPQPNNPQPAKQAKTQQTPEWKRLLKEKQRKRNQQQDFTLDGPIDVEVEVQATALTGSNKHASRWEQMLRQKETQVATEKEIQYRQNMVSRQEIERDTKLDKALGRAIDNFVTGKDIEEKLEEVQREGEITQDMMQGLIKEDERKELSFEFCGKFDILGPYLKGSKKRIELSKNLVEMIIAHDVSHINCFNSALDDYFVEELCSAIKAGKLHNLRSLNIELNQMGDDAMRALCEVLSDNTLLPKFTELRLDNQKELWSTNAEEMLEQAIKENKRIVRLSLTVRNMMFRSRIDKYISRNLNVKRRRRSTMKSDNSPRRATTLSGDLNDVQLQLQAVRNNEIEELEYAAERLFLALSEFELLEFAESLAANTSLKKLKLTNVNLSRSFAEVLARSLQDNRALEYLDLTNNRIPADCIIAIFEALKFNVTLRAIHVGEQSGAGCIISSQHEGRIIEALEENNTLVRIGGLIFRNVQYKRKLDKKIATNQDIVRKNRSLARRTLEAAENGDPASIQAIDEVKYSGPDLGQETIECVAERTFIALPEEQHLEMAKLLKENTSVKKLILRKVHLTQNFGFAIAECLRVNKCLEYVDLENNEISCDAIQAICVSLSVNSTLKELKVRHQRNAVLSTANENTIVDALSENKTILKLGISFRNTQAQGKLDKILRQNQDAARRNRNKRKSFRQKQADEDSVTQAAIDEKKEYDPVEMKTDNDMVDLQFTYKGPEPDQEVLNLIEDRVFMALSSDHKVYFARKLAQNTIVKKLILKRMNLDGTFAVALAESLTTNTCLTFLDIEDNRINSEGQQAIFQALRENTTVTEIRIRNQRNGLLSSVDEVAILEALEANNTILKVGIDFRQTQNRNKLDKHLKRMQDAARKKRRKSRTPTQIGAQNVAVEEKKEETKEALVVRKPRSRARKSLVETDKNKETYRGKLACILANDPSVAEFEADGDFRFLALSRDIQLELFSAFAENVTVTSLKLVNVDLRDVHALAMAESLRSNCSLEVLDLSSNSFSSEGMQALCEALAANTTLIEFHVRDLKKPLSTAAEYAIADAINVNQTLRKFTVSIRNTSAKNKADRAIRRNQKAWRERG